MWLKLCFLLIYITFLFILARVLEAISWYETGALSRRLIDPMTLSVMKLKALIEQRGVSFEGVLEKTDLTELVEGTGPVTKEEVALSSVEEEASAVTNFTSGTHFIEQVEDAKDSVWLIQILTHEAPMLLPDPTWKTLRKKVSRFGVRAGVLDCSLDTWYCNRKGWHTPRLILALPEEFQTKAGVKIHTYMGSTKESLMFSWIREKLDMKIEKISDYKHLRLNWLDYQDEFLKPEIRAVLFTQQKSVPMFFSALSVKFPGRVKFGTVCTSTVGGKEILMKLKSNNKTLILTTSFMIITAENVFYYGTRVGENLTFSAMEKFFKSLYPCLNDIFIVSFLVANILSWFELCLVQGKILKRLQRFICCIVKYNVIVIMLWLPLIGIFQLPYLDKVPLWCLKVIRIFSTTTMASHLRKDFSFYSMNYSVLLGIFVAYGFIIGFIEYKRKGGEEPIEDTDEDYWNFTQMRTMEYLFRPRFNYNLLGPGPLVIGISDLEGGNIPLNPPAYIKDLPTWRYAPLPKFKESCRRCKEADKGRTCICRCYDQETDSRHEQPNLNVGQIFGNKSHNTQPYPACSDQSESPCSCASHISINNSNENDDAGMFPNAPILFEEEKTTSKVLGFVKGSDLVFESVNTGFPSGFIFSSQCVICLDDYQFSVMLCGLPCGHTFHENCVVTWLKRGSNFCPVCRWPAFKAKSCQIHLHSE